MSITRLNLRHELARMCNDLISGKADSGTTTTIVDDALTQTETDFCKGWDVYIYEGTNIGAGAQATAFTPASDQITLAPAFASVIDNTSRYELHHRFTVAEYNYAIDRALDLVREQLLVATHNAGTVLVANQYEYAFDTVENLPLRNFHYFTEIIMESSTEGVYNGEDIISPKYWRILPAGFQSAYSKLWFDKALWSPTAGRKLRILGLVPHDVLTSDDSTLYFGQAFILYQAKAFLHESKIRPGGIDLEAQRDQMLIAQQRADFERRRISTRMPPFARRANR